MRPSSLIGLRQRRRVLDLPVLQSGGQPELIPTIWLRASVLLESADRESAKLALHSIRRQAPR